MMADMSEPTVKVRPGQPNFTSAQAPSSGDSLMCGPEAPNQSIAPGPTGPGGPIDHRAASQAFSHYADVPTYSEHPPIKLGSAPKTASAPPKPKAPPKKPPATPPPPKQEVLPPLPPMTKEEEEKFYMPPDLYAKTRGKSPEERAAIMHDRERRESMSEKQYKDTQGLSDEQAAAKIRDQEMRKTLPPDLDQKWDSLSPEERTKALHDHEMKLRSERPTQAPPPSQ